MDKLLVKLRQAADQGEIYYLESATNSVDFQNGRLHDLESRYQSGYSLRLIKDGFLGSAYTRNLLDENDFINNALTSIQGKIQAGYDFPLTTRLPSLETYDPEIAAVGSNILVEECDRISSLVKSQTNAEIELGALQETSNLKITNTNGTRIGSRHSRYFLSVSLIYPGGGAGLDLVLLAKAFCPLEQHLLDELIRMYNLSQKPVTTTGGPMQVLFLPASVYTLTWRLLSATSGKNILEQVSPVADRTDELILSPLFSLQDDPLNDELPGARTFDDEGTATQSLMIYQNGVLKNFYNDLEYGWKNGTGSTGHGYRAGMWGGDPITMKPSPNLQHLNILPGHQSLNEMIKMMDRGIILAGAMGAHSGNIPNGDFSVGVSPGILVEHGKIIGRVKDAMVAGNVYTVLKDIIAIENRQHPTWGGIFPAILCDKVNVSTRI